MNHFGPQNIDGTLKLIPLAPGTGTKYLGLDSAGILQWMTTPSLTDTYVSSASFATGTGVITLTKSDASTVTVNIDGRYSLTSHNHTLDSLSNVNTTGIGNGQGISWNGSTWVPYTFVNQTITFSPTGDVTATSNNTGTTTLAPVLAIGAGKVTNTMLAGSIDLTTKVTGILPSANGGTGNGFTKFTGATTSEKTYTLPNASTTILTTNATVTETQGGTGQNTYTLGDILYSSATNTLSKLAGNITTTKKFLTQTGNASISAAPSWGTISSGDVSGLGSLATLSAITGNNGLTANTSTNLQLGGTLSQTTTLAAASNTFQITDAGYVNFTSALDTFETPNMRAHFEFASRDIHFYMTPGDDSRGSSLWLDYNSGGRNIFQLQSWYDPSGYYSRIQGRAWDGGSNDGYLSFQMHNNNFRFKTPATLSTADKLAGFDSAGANSYGAKMGYITIGSGLSLSSGTLSATGGSSSGGTELRFYVGNPGYPADEENTYTDAIGLVGKKINVYREGERQMEGNTTTGITYDSVNGVITFYPTLRSGEAVIIEIYDTAGWTVTTAQSGVGRRTESGTYRMLEDGTTYRILE